MTRFFMIFWYIFYCLKNRVNPWWFFQLNAGYFNSKKGIFSKYEINKLIPAKWRLGQYFDNPAYFPISFPVFLKPEWGQNSYGIYRADNLDHLKHIRKNVAKKNFTYLVQESAEEAKEYEIFYIRDATKTNKPAVLTITEVENSNMSKFPINGVHNIYSSYIDRTEEFSNDALDQIWNHLGQIGPFWISRVGLKANNKTDLINGNFHIVEINLFTPMPLNLLDKRKSWKERAAFIEKSMFEMTRCTKVVSKRKERKNIFFRKLIMHYRVKS